MTARAEEGNALNSSESAGDVALSWLSFGAALPRALGLFLSVQNRTLCR